MEIAILSDLHFSKSTNEYEQEKQNELKKFFIEFFRKRGVECIISVGDLLRKNELNRMNLETIKELNDFIYETMIPFYAISGNHDQLNDYFFDEELKNKTTGTTALDFLKSIKVDNSSIIFGYGIKIDFVPFYRTGEDFKKAVLHLNKKNESSDSHLSKRVLVCHQSPEGSNFPSDDMVNFKEEMFEIYDIIFCGHIHEPKIIKLSAKTTLYQVGACMSYKKSEIGEKFVHILNLKTGKVKRVKIPVNIEYMKINIDNEKIKKEIKEGSASFDLETAIKKISKGKNEDYLDTGINYFNKLKNDNQK